MLTKLQNFKDEREAGFTLIELLVVILIIGILSAIAIPAFLNQRKSAVDASVQSDVSNAAKQVETLAVKAGALGGEVSILGTTGEQSTIKVAGVGEPITITMEVSDGTDLTASGNTAKGYTITGKNAGGDVAASSGFTYDSINGGMARASATASGPVVIDESKTYASGYSASIWTASNEYSGDMMVNFTFNEDGTVDYKAVTDSSFTGTVNFIAMDGMTMETRSFSFSLSGGKAQAAKVSSTPYNQNFENSGTAVLGGVQYTLQ